MRPATILNLSSVLFKSYLRASSRDGVNLTYSRPWVMLLVDLFAIATPLLLLQYSLPRLPEALIGSLESIAWQALVGLPIIITSAIISAGILFEVGQGSGISSSEVVNWLPISPREYVLASAMSMATVYSPILAISVGITLPLSLRFGMMRIWPATVALSALALLLGAFVVEVLRAAMNRVSSTVYRRSGRIGIISRLVLLVALFVVVQQAFNPYILYYVLGIVVRGVNVVWFVPVVWPSVAIVDLVRLELPLAIAFSALSVAFTSLIFEVASNLRLRYWSPVPISIVIESSAEYVPQATALSRFGFSPLEASLAMKDFRALVRRKDMARFLTIPVIMIIAFFLPILFSPSDYAGRSPGLFLSAFIPFMVPLMLSMIAIGQEGKDVINLYMLPIPPKALIKGKLLPSWVISALTTVVVVAGFEIIAPVGALTLVASFLASAFVIVVEAFIGLGIASRYPDFAVGSNSRYVTFTGFFLGFLIGGVATIAIFAPASLYLLSSRGMVQVAALSFPLALAITIIIGSALSFLALLYCKRGVERFLANLET
jgi:hypothetical protein